MTTRPLFLTDDILELDGAAWDAWIKENLEKLHPIDRRWFALWDQIEIGLLGTGMDATTSQLVDGSNDATLAVARKWHHAGWIAACPHESDRFF